MQSRYAKLTKMGCPKLVPYEYIFMNPMFQQMNSVSPYSGMAADYKTEEDVIKTIPPGGTPTFGPRVKREKVTLEPPSMKKKSKK